MDIENLAKELILKNMTPEQQMAVLESVRQSVANAKEVQKKKIGENVDLVVQALKKIESDIRDRFDAVGNSIEKRVLSIKDGRDGANGTDGRDGKDGKSGKDGIKGDRGIDGQTGRDGIDGVDGISVVNAHIDFDGSLVISLSDGRELNVGEVVSQDIAEKIKVISTMSTNGAIAVKEEGSTLTNGVKSINFVGTGITATTSGDDVTVTVSGGSGTVTSVSALTLGTSGTDLSSTVANSTTTPVITLNVPTASATNRGALSSADWTTFNNKGSGTVTSVAATAGTGISITGSPITTSGTLTITNSAPDQTVALTQGGTTTITGTYPNFTISSADQFQGTVTSVTGTSPVVSSGGATPAISLAASYGDTQNPYASKTANFVLAAPNGSAGVPTFRAVVAADIPTLNQNTTGSAATVTTTINSGVVATTQTAGDNSTKVATTAYVNAVTGTNGISGFKNRIINGQMQLAQRATSATITAGSTIAAGYSTVDRFYVYCTGANVTAAQVAGANATKSRLRITGAASVTAVGIGQRIEQLNSYDLAGSTATLSADLAISATLTTVTWTASYATTTADTFGTLASPTVTQIATGTFTVTSTVTNFSTNISIPAAATTGIQIVFTVGALTAGLTWTIGNVQLEKGSTATSFDYRPYGTELQLCQRYYYPVRGSGQFADVVGTTTDNMFFGTSFPVEMRATPTMTGVLTALVVSNFSTAYTASGGSYSFNGTSTQGVNVRKGGFTTLNTVYRYFVSSTSIVVTADAEL